MEKSKIPIVIKGKKIDGAKPQICVPLVSKTEGELIREVEDIVAMEPDLVEWRVDYFEDVADIEKVMTTLRKIHPRLVNYPIIFTCRTIEEGGHQEIQASKRIELMKAVIGTQQVDMVDIELMNGMNSIKEVLQEADKNHVKLIISNHDFNRTPSKETIIERLMKAQEYGADIAKIAVMPTSERDVLTLLEATLEAREKHVKVPLITMAMGGKGVITRIAGGLFGSVITFAAGKASSAPGQIGIEQLRQAIEILHKDL